MQVILMFSLYCLIAAFFAPMAMVLTFMAIDAISDYLDRRRVEKRRKERENHERMRMG